MSEVADSCKCQVCPSQALPCLSLEACQCLSVVQIDSTSLSLTRTARLLPQNHPLGPPKSLHSCPWSLYRRTNQQHHLPVTILVLNLTLARFSSDEAPWWCAAGVQSSAASMTACRRDRPEPSCCLYLGARTKHVLKNCRSAWLKIRNHPLAGNVPLGQLSTTSRLPCYTLQARPEATGAS